MSRLVEAAHQQFKSDLNLGPSKDLDLTSDILLPERLSQVAGRAPLSTPILDCIDGLATHEFIWHNVEREATKQRALQQVIDGSRQVERSFLGWDMVRRDGGTTGFEGYGAGYFSSSTDLAEAIAKLGAGLLAQQKRYKAQCGDYTFMNRLWKFIGPGVYDPEIASYLYDIFTGTLARLKATTLGNSAVEDVRQTVYRLAGSLPEINYFPPEQTKEIGQAYILPEPTLVEERLAEIMPTGAVDPNTFVGRPEYWGYLLMLKLGVFGHPVVRSALKQQLLKLDGSFIR